MASAAALLLAAACTDTVTVEAPSLSAGDAQACAALVQVLPEHVADQARRSVQVGNGYGAAWGDPAIELRCGVPAPAGFDEFSSCTTANGVDWFIPEAQQSGRPTAVTMTTVGRAQNVEVRIPADYFPPVNTMVDLGPALKRTIRSVKPCV